MTLSLAVRFVAVVLLMACASRVVGPSPPPPAQPNTFEGFTETSLIVLANDFWDATEQASLFYFRTADVLRALGETCPANAAKPAGEEWDYRFVPWLQHVCKTSGAHVFPREGGLKDAAATMNRLRATKTLGVVCCGHRTFVEMGHPGDFQLRDTNDGLRCAQGTLIGFDKLTPVGEEGLSCNGQLVWPDVN